MRQKFPANLAYWLIFISSLPFLWLLTKPEIRGDFISNFASITGLIGLVLMIWQMLLSNRFLLQKITPDYVSSIKLHTFLGINGFFFIMLHPWLEMISYGEKLSFVLFPNLSTEFYRHVVFGQIAIGIYLLIWITSAIIREKIKYRLWRYLHYLTYPIIFFVFLHSKSLGIHLNTIPFLKVYWTFLLFLYIAFGLARAWQFFFNGGKKEYVLKTKLQKTPDIFYYTLSPKGEVLKPQPGQFFFIKAGLYSESHPFSVMDFDKATGDLVFGVKNVGVYSKSLEGLNLGQSVYIDGPYGVFTKEGQNNNPKVIVAGGIGVTPFVDLVKNFSNQNTFMFNANRYIKDVIDRAFFKNKLGVNYIDIISREQVSEQRLEAGRINQQVLSKYLAQKILDTANFFVCGSPGFTKTTVEALKKLKINQERIFVEEFSF